MTLTRTMRQALKASTLRERRAAGDHPLVREVLDRFPGAEVSAVSVRARVDPLHYLRSRSVDAEIRWPWLRELVRPRVTECGW